MGSPSTSYRRHQLIKQLTGFTPCCICGGIPSLELVSQWGDKEQPMTRVERYCETCASKVYERAEPSDSDKLAEKYGCTIGELPRTPPSD